MGNIENSAVQAAIRAANQKMHQLVQEGIGGELSWELVVSVMQNEEYKGFLTGYLLALDLFSMDAVDLNKEANINNI
jgi:hypothetical protein